MLFIGDDLGDIPAFDALVDLRAEGIPAIGVVSDSPEVSGLREKADLVLPGPDAIVDFLRALIDQLDASQGRD